MTHLSIAQDFWPLKTTAVGQAAIVVFLLPRAPARHVAGSGMP